MTPIQLARAFCAIANNGKLVQPYIIEKSINGNDEITEYEPRFINCETITRSAPLITKAPPSVMYGMFPKKIFYSTWTE